MQYCCSYIVTQTGFLNCALFARQMPPFLFSLQGKLFMIGPPHTKKKINKIVCLHALLIHTAVSNSSLHRSQSIFWDTQKLPINQCFCWVRSFNQMQDKTIFLIALDLCSFLQSTTPMGGMHLIRAGKKKRF